MAERTYEYRPDYTVTPGDVLDEVLGEREISHAEFARRCGRSPKLISEIISGKAPIEPETAIQFEHVLGMDASLWLNLDSRYRLNEAKQVEGDRLAAAKNWAAQFPIKDAVKLGIFEAPQDEADKSRKLLAFFGVADIGVWNQRFHDMAVAYRQSQKFKTSDAAISIWLRQGERLAEQRKCRDYNRSDFLNALKTIRGLTRLKIEEFVPKIEQACDEAGVAFVLVPPLPKTALSGAAHWLNARKALIQQSLRYKSNDHFWFTFFHEAAHILLHSKQMIFVEEGRSLDTELEKEADEWASNFLIPRAALNEFRAAGLTSQYDILEFSEQLEIDPGIVIGMLQHEELIPWGSQLNRLKKKFEWVAE